MKKPLFQKEWNAEAYQLRFHQAWVPCIDTKTGKLYQLYITKVGEESMRVTGYGPDGWMDGNVISYDDIHPVYIQLPPVYWPVLNHESFKFQDNQIQAVLTIKRMVKSYQQGVSQATYKIWNPQIKVADVSKVVPKFVEDGELISPDSLVYDTDKALGSFGPISPEMCFWRGRLYFLDSVIGLFNKSMTKVTVLPNYVHEVAECLASFNISITRF